MSQERESGDQRSDLDEVLADYLRRVDRGECIAPEALIAAHPPLAAQLRSYFSQANAIERLTADATINFDDQATPRAGHEVHCPSCNSLVKLAVGTALASLTCPSCGESIRA